MFECLKLTVFAGVITVLGIGNVALAEPATPVADHRQENQEQRIGQGVENGSLTNREMNKLEAQQNRIERAEDRMKSDNVMTRSERTRLAIRQDKASRNIYRKKHNLRRQ